MVTKFYFLGIKNKMVDIIFYISKKFFLSKNCSMIAAI